MIFDDIVDGSYPEGDSYVVTFSDTYFNALWAVNRRLPSQLLEEERLKRYPLFYLFNAAPDKLWNALTNHGDFFTSSRENYAQAKDLHLVATVHHDRLAAWVAEQYYYHKVSQFPFPEANFAAVNNIISGFIFLNPAMAPQSPAEVNLDLSYHAPDWEGAFMRSNWTEEAVAAAIKVGPPGGHTAFNVARSNYQSDRWIGGGQEPTEFELNAGHLHADANGIYLYANGAYLLPELHGYTDSDSTPWGLYTSSHNTILVSDDQGRMRGQIQGDLVSGATALGYKEWQPGNEYFWDYEKPGSEVGIMEHASTIGYSYSLGQATSAYWPELGLQRFHRHLLFVRNPGYMLVVDDLNAAAEKTYAWMGHSTGAVTQEGQWLKVYADNNQRLGLAVLSPPSFTFTGPADEWEGLELRGIYAFRYISKNRTMYEWSFAQTCQRCRFITLLFPTDESHWSQKPVVARLKDTDLAAAVRVDFQDTDRTDVLAISLLPGQVQTVDDVTFDGRAAAVERDGGAIRRILLVHGSDLTEGGTPLIQNLPDAAFIEVQYEGQKLSIRTPDPTGVTLFAPGVTTVLWQSVDANNIITTQSVSFRRNGDYVTLTP